MMMMMMLVMMMMMVVVLESYDSPVRFLRSLNLGLAGFLWLACVIKRGKVVNGNAEDGRSLLLTFAYYISKGKMCGEKIQVSMWENA